LAHACGDELELMHVIPPRDVPVYRVPGWEANRRRVVANAAGKLRAIASEAEARFHVPVTVYIAIGTPHTEIAARADASGARLVVVGPHGERPVRDMFVGETAQRLRRILRPPLLIVRNRSTRRYERALIAVDFDASSAQAAHAAAGLFPDAALHFVHVASPPFEGRVSLAGVSAQVMRTYRNHALLEASRELDHFIRSNGLQSRRGTSVVKRGHIPTRIRETADEVGASVVAFGAEGKSRLEANLLGSVSGEFLSGTGHDVLLAKAIGTSRASERPDGARKRDIEAETAKA
jgi:nucleotide-binding universal stress UspA family protein